MSKAVDMASVADGTSGTNTYWYAYFHTGHNHDELIFHMGVAPAFATGSPSITDPTCYWEIYNTSDTLIETTDKIHYNFQSGRNDVYPDDINWSTVGASSLADDTTYYALLKCTDYCRPYACCIHETGNNPIDTGTTGCMSPSFQAGAPVYDVEMEALLNGSEELYRSNGRHILSLSRDTYGATDGWLVDWGAAAYTNILDGSSTTPGAATPGVKIDMEYHHTLSRTTIPVKMAIRAKRSSGSGTVTNNSVRLYNGSDIAVEVNGVDDSEKWHVGTGNINNTYDKWDLQAISDNAGPDEYYIYAVSIFAFE
jgi:hypothetical protein